MKHQLRHEHREDTEEELSGNNLHTNEASLTFESPEEMIRHDSQQTELPPVIRERVMQSIAAEPKSPTPWWKRWKPF